MTKQAHYKDLSKNPLKCKHVVYSTSDVLLPQQIKVSKEVEHGACKDEELTYIECYQVPVI